MQLCTIAGFGEKKKRKAVERPAAASGDTAEKKPRIGDEAAKGSKVRMDVNDAVDRGAQKTKQEKNFVQSEVAKIFKNNWGELVGPTYKKAIDESMPDFVKNVQEKIDITDQMKKVQLVHKKGERKWMLEMKGAAKPVDLESTKTYRYVKGFEALKGMKPENEAEAVKMIKEFGEFVFTPCICV